MKPMALITKEEQKKYKRSEREFQARRDLEVKLGGKNFIIDKRVASSPAAKEKWDYLISLFKDPKLDFITDTDSELINRYCLIYASYLDKVDLLENLKNKFSGNLFKGMNELENMIIKYSDHMSKLEDRMYLSPTAKVKGAAKVQTELKRDDPLYDNGFDDV